MEQLAAWMIANGFATGHGDTIDALLSELAWQIEEPRYLRDALRELADAVGEMPENALGTIQGQRVNAAHSLACKVLGDDK